MPGESSPALDALTELVKSGGFSGDNIFQRRAEPTSAPALQAAPAPAEDNLARLSLRDLEDEQRKVELRNQIRGGNASASLSNLNPVQQKLVGFYAEHFGEPPKKADGSYDLDEVNRGVKDLGDEATGMKMNFGQKTLLESIPAHLRGRAFGADGKVLPTAALAKLLNESNDLGKPLTDAQKADEQSKIQKIAEIRTQMEAAKSRVNGTGANRGVSAVGPIRGAAVGRLAALVTAVGGDDKVLNNQRLLEQFVNQQILQGASQMKGNLSDRDVKFLEKSVPKLSDPVATWNSYLDELTGFLQNRENSAKSVLAGQPVTPASGTPAAGGGAGVTPAAAGDLPVVKNAADMERLKKAGVKRVRFEDGTEGIL